MLEIHDLQKSFGDLHVLRGINLNIQKGDVVAVLGSSGSGKTTLLRCMNFLEHADAGTMVFDGQQVELSRITHAQIHALRRRTGFVFQNYNLVPVLNVYENIVLPIQLDGKAPDPAYLDQIVDTLGLGAKLHSLPNQLSGGQQQRVAIARALAAKPAILLADEPTGNLDSKTSQDVMGLLKVTSQRFAQTIVMITHNEEIAQMADRIVRIEDGRITTRG